MLKKYIYLAIVLFFIFSQSAVSQPLAFDTMYTQGHIGYAMMPNGEGYAIAGNHDNGDLWLFQVNEQGQLLWEQTYGRHYGLFDITFMHDAKAFNSNYFLTGNSFSIPDTNWGKFFGYVIKADSLGNQLWDRLFYTTYDSSRTSEFYNVTPTSDGGCLLSGRIVLNPDDTVPSESRFYVVKLDSLGNVVYGKTYKNGPSNSTFDTGKSTGLELPDNKGYLVGTTYGNGNQGYLMRLNNQGDTIWTRKYGPPPGSSPLVYTEIEDMIFTSPNRILMAMGSYLMEVDTLGVPIWANYDAGVSNISELPNSELAGVRIDVLFRLSDSGTILWQRHYSSYGFSSVDFIRFVEVIPAQDGGLIILVNTLSGLRLLKTDCYGNVINPVACATSVEFSSVKVLQVYPNPSASAFTVELSPAHRYKIEVTDASGALIAKGASLYESRYVWDAGEYPPGLYVMRVKNEATGEVKYARMVRW